MKQEKYKVGEKVILKRGEWGIKNGMTTLVDVIGTIVTKKGMAGHNNVHKYAVKHRNGTTFNDGSMIRKLKNHGK